MRRKCAKISVALCFTNINDITKRAKLKVMCDIAILGIMKRAKQKIIEKHAPHMCKYMCRVVFLQY